MMRLQWRDSRLAIHFALTMIVAGFGFVLALPSEKFNISAFETFSRMGTENQWSIALWIISTIGLIGMTTHSKAVRLISVLLLASAHGVIGICFATAPQFGTGGVTYPVIAGLGYYLAWRRTVEGV